RSSSDQRFELSNGRPFSPLFEEKRDSRGGGLVARGAEPLRVSGAGVVARLSAGDNPVDPQTEITFLRGPQCGLVADKSHGGGRGLVHQLGEAAAGPFVVFNGCPGPCVGGPALGV